MLAANHLLTASNMASVISTDGSKRNPVSFSANFRRCRAMGMFSGEKKAVFQPCITASLTTSSSTSSLLPSPGLPVMVTRRFSSKLTRSSKPCSPTFMPCCMRL